MAKSTDQFKEIIQSKLEEMASNDKLFAVSFKKKNKNIDDCIKYILNTVQKSGVCGYADEEIFGMAAHYYDEDDIKVGKSVNCKIVTNQPTKQKESKPKPTQKVSPLQVVKRPTQSKNESVSKKKLPQEKLVATQQSLF